MGLDVESRAKFQAKSWNWATDLGQKNKPNQNKNSILEWKDTLRLSQNEDKKGEASLALLPPWVTVSLFIPTRRGINIFFGFFGPMYMVVLDWNVHGRMVIVCLTVCHHWIFCSNPRDAYSNLTRATVAHTSCILCPAWRQGSINIWPDWRCSCFCLEDIGIHNPENR